ncbi:hypothetical protein [Bradyrhizobium sp. S3.2.12]|uniref:hypothetical protein n=1 Tax=unclassified Bradyrhizobium TaxID=2631580 RepID=UPI003394325A
MAVIISVLFGSSPFALAQSNSSSDANRTLANSSSTQGTTGTNVGGTIQTNQGNSFGNSATGGQVGGTSRTGQPSTSQKER